MSLNHSTSTRATEEQYCGKCRYVLRGLPTSTCPECGSDLNEVGVICGSSRSAGILVLRLIAFTALAILGTVFTQMLTRTLLPKHLESGAMAQLTVWDDRGELLVTLHINKSGWLHGDADSLPIVQRTLTLYYGEGDDQQTRLECVDPDEGFNETRPEGAVAEYARPLNSVELAQRFQAVSPWWDKEEARRGAELVAELVRVSDVQKAFDQLLMEGGYTPFTQVNVHSDMGHVNNSQRWYNLCTYVVWSVLWLIWLWRESRTVQPIASYWWLFGKTIAIYLLCSAGNGMAASARWHADPRADHAWFYTLMSVIWLSAFVGGVWFMARRHDRRWRVTATGRSES